MTEVKPLAIVTGGSRGIGRAIVKRLARAGYDVLFTYRSAVAEAQQLAAELEASACSVEAHACDLGEPDQVEALCVHVARRPQAPRALVCNAGSTADALSTLTDLRGARELFQVNFFSYVQLLKALGRPMARAGQGGRIVVLGSIASELGTQGNALYAASKGALQSHMRSVIEEFARKGLTVNCVRPGFIDTDMTSRYPNQGERAERRIPAQRLGSPDEVAALVEFLVSPAAGYINGASIAIDGGLSATLGWS